MGKLAVEDIAVIFEPVAVFQHIFIDEFAHTVARILDKIVCHLVVGVQRKGTEPVDDHAVELRQRRREQLVNQRAIEAVERAVRLGDDLLAGIAAFAKEKERLRAETWRDQYVDDAFLALRGENAVVGNALREIVEMVYRLAARNDVAALFDLHFLRSVKEVGKKKEAVILPEKILHLLVG